MFNVYLFIYLFMNYFPTHYTREMKRQTRLGKNKNNNFFNVYNMEVPCGKGKKTRQRITSDLLNARKRVTRNKRNPIVPATLRNHSSIINLI